MKSIYDWNNIYERLNKCLRLHATPVVLKRYKSTEELNFIPKLRRPDKTFVACQLMAQAVRLNFTIGFTNDDLFGTQCACVLGLRERDKEFFSGKQFLNVWYGTIEDSAKHQESMYCASTGYEAVAVSPLVSGRLKEPDICLIYLNPGQMIHIVNGLQYTGYEVIQSSIVGESSCSDTWGKALQTGKPSVSIPCYAERRYGGVLDDEMLICLTPAQLLHALDGMEHLSKNGLRYPYAPYGIQNDCREGMGASYKS